MPRFQASRRKARDGAPVSRRALRAATPEPAPATPLDPPLRPRALDRLELALLTLLPLVIAIAFHPIGDPYTESDFYGAYAGGARALLAGHVDPARYGIYGPAYEWLLALIGLTPLDLFFGAKLLSVVSAAVVLASTWAMVARSLGRAAARWAVLLVAATPVFLRYAYSATTDMPAAAFGAAGLALLFLARRRRSLVLAGVLVALATLTRYQAVVLLPAGILIVALRRSPPKKGALAAAFALAFALAITPWTAWSVAHGFVPGRSLVGNYRFYAIENGSRNVQDALQVDESGNPVAPATTAPESPLVLWPRRLVEHAKFDVTVMLGRAFALAAALGALVWAWRRPGADGGAWLLSAGFLYLGLVPAFYSDRYRLLLVPIAAAAAAALWIAPFARSRAGRAVTALALAAVVATLGVRSWRVQHKVWFELPRDVLAVAPAVAHDGLPGPVIARKGHIGYYTDRPVIALPRVASLATLGALARASHARYLYFSWYEAQMRPELLALMDTTRTLPGLERVAVCPFPAGVLYRIGPSFGEPGWFADDRAKAVAEARAAIWTLADSMKARGRSVLAADAFLRGDYTGAVVLARMARRDLPGDTLAMWVEEYGEAKLAGLGERSPVVRALRADPNFGWIARETKNEPRTLEERAHRPPVLIGPTTGPPGISGDEDFGIQSPP